MSHSRRIIVTGANGRLGAALVREWNAAGESVAGLRRADLDLAWDVPRMRSAIESLEFAVLVNCAAQTNVDRCESEEDEALQLNAEGPTILADICRRKGARMIHISTDYVFDGKKTTPYTEDDAAMPVSIYGASKRTGESGVLTASEGRALVVRVSWIFGPDKPSFVDQILQKARVEEHVAAIADKIAVPTYTLDAARLLRPFLFDHADGGLLHLCNSGRCSWQEYGQHALDCAVAAGVPMRGRTVAPLRMAEMKAFIAKRPPFTAMSTEKLTQITGLRPRDWREAVAEHVASTCRA